MRRHQPLDEDKTPCLFYTEISLVVRRLTCVLSHAAVIYLVYYILAFGASFSSGWNTSLLNGMLSEKDDVKGSLVSDVHLTSTWKELLTTALIVGAACGSFAGIIPERLGYRRTLTWVVAPLYMVGSAMCLFPKLPLLIAGRFVSGLGTGLGGIIAPVLLAEVSSPKTRGLYTSFHQFFITIGILSSGLLNYAFVKPIDHGWRIMFLLGLVPPLTLMLLGVWFAPESPRWLLRRPNGTKDARQFLLNVRSLSHDIDGELEQMESEVEEERQLLLSGGMPAWHDVFCGRYALPMTLGCFLMLIQTLSGINTVVFYSSTIFEIAGVEDPLLATAIVFLVNVFFTVMGMWAVDNWGRRRLLAMGYLTMTLSLVGLSGCLIAMPKSHTQGSLAILFALTYLSGFAFGPGSVAFTVLGEIVPTRVRSKAYGVFMSVNWVCLLLLSQLTLTTIDALGGGTDPDQQRRGAGIMYAIFAGVCFIGLVFVVAFIPETKGRHLEQLQRELMRATCCSLRSVGKGAEVDGERRGLIDDIDHEALLNYSREDGHDPQQLPGDQHEERAVEMGGTETDGEGGTYDYEYRQEEDPLVLLRRELGILNEEASQREEDRYR